MANQHEIQIAKLEKKIIDLKKTLSAVGEGKDLDAILSVMHWPGWTSLRDVAFSAALLDSINAHAQAIVKTQKELLRGAKASSKELSNGK